MINNSVNYYKSNEITILKLLGSTFISAAFKWCFIEVIYDLFIFSSLGVSLVNFINEVNAFTHTELCTRLFTSGLNCFLKFQEVKGEKLKVKSK